MVSVPKVPSNSALQVGGGGAQGELLVDGQGLAGVAGGHDDLLLVASGPGRRARRGSRRVDAVGEVGRRRPRTRRRCRPAPGRGSTSAAPAGPQPWPVARSSWALSQTATTRSSRVEDVGDVAVAVRAPGRGVGGGRRRPRRGAPAVRGGCRPRWPGPGCGRSTSRRPAASGPSCGCTRTPPAPPPEQARWAAAGRGRRGRARRSCGVGLLRSGAGSPARRLRARAGDGPAGSTVIPSRAASSPGEASPQARVSTIVSRPGSPSAACSAARRTTEPELASVDIESIFVEVLPGCQPMRRPAAVGQPVSAASVSRSGARSCEADRRASGRTR